LTRYQNAPKFIEVFLKERFNPILLVPLFLINAPKNYQRPVYTNSDFCVISQIKK
jgi:hypothetical protein